MSVLDWCTIQSICGGYECCSAEIVVACFANRFSCLQTFRKVSSLFMSNGPASLWLFGDMYCACVVCVRDAKSLNHPQSESNNASMHFALCQGFVRVRGHLGELTLES